MESTKSKKGHTVFQNGHVTVLNPAWLEPPGKQFLELRRQAEDAPPIREGEIEKFNSEGRKTRPLWALTADAGIIASLRVYDSSGNGQPDVYFRNNTADREAAIERHRTLIGGEGPKEFFFLASSKQGPKPELFLDGWLADKWDVYVPSGAPGNHPAESQLYGRPARLIAPVSGAPVSYRKFHYDSGGTQFIEIAEAVGRAAEIYMQAGWSEDEVLQRVALPAMRAASAGASAVGYHAVAGVVYIPRDAIAADSGGELLFPLLMNLSYDVGEELFRSLCCMVTRVDPAVLNARGAGDYPLIVSEVIEGVEEGHVSPADDGAAFLDRFFLEIRRDGDGAGPGEDEEIAQEIARAALQQRDDTTGAEMSWTQVVADSFCLAAERRGERAGRIARRAQEVVVAAAALEAVHPSGGDPYGQWIRRNSGSMVLH